ncbi:MAG: TatD family nuclease-associated radical SAM protein [candidate division Zixibacteria bacterium]|nr:TatD family nuclease-associated radical SAM protein [candidate division Zixibacteria bacterium]
MPPTDESAILAYELHGNCYLNITSECTLRCQFCPKYNRTWAVQSYDLTLPYEPTVAEVLEAIGDPHRYKEIVFCGLGEPTKRFDTLMEIAGEMKREGMRVRVNTDGLANLVEGRDVTSEMAQAVDFLSISLNAQNEEVYNRHTRPRRDGAYDAMLDFAKKAKAAGMDVTLSAIDGLEGVDISACQAIADKLGLKFRRRVLDDVG